MHYPIILSYVDLEEMKDHIGQASTFISYAQAGAWGDLVAALLDGGADDTKRGFAAG